MEEWKKKYLELCIKMELYEVTIVKMTLVEALLQYIQLSLFYINIRIKYILLDGE